MPEKGRRTGGEAGPGGARPRGAEERGRGREAFPASGEPAKKGDPPIEWPRDAPRSRNGRPATRGDSR